MVCPSIPSVLAMPIAVPAYFLPTPAVSTISVLVRGKKHPETRPLSATSIQIPAPLAKGIRTRVAASRIRIGTRTLLREPSLSESNPMGILVTRDAPTSTVIAMSELVSLQPRPFRIGRQITLHAEISAKGAEFYDSQQPYLFVADNMGKSFFKRDFFRGYGNRRELPRLPVSKDPDKT